MTDLNERIDALTAKKDDPQPKEPPTVATAENLHEVTKEYATIGKNPRKEQVTRLKKAIKQLELAQEELARMGAVYMEYDNEKHSDYCQGLYIAIEGVKAGMTTFLTHM